MAFQSNSVARRIAGRMITTVLLAITLIMGSLVARPALAAEKLGNSLDFIPADAAFYSSSLRLQQQVDILLKSKAWATLMGMPSLQLGIAGAQMQMNTAGGPMQQYQEWYKQPENQELIELLKDGVSDEVFLYGDKSFAGFTGVALEAMNSARFAPMFSRLLDPFGAVDQEQVAAMAVLESLNENLENVVVPDFVIGFKLNNKSIARAQAQLKRLEAFVVKAAEDVPELKDRFKRVRVGDAEFLTLSGDGKMIPWDQIPFDDLEPNPGDYRALRQQLQELTIAVSIGVKDGYLLISIGNNNDHLAALGKGPLLIDSAELKPLREHLSKPIVGVGYMSKAMHATVATKKEDLDGLVEMAGELLPSAELDEEVEKAVLADIELLAKDLKQFVPDPGASMGFSYLTPRGYEGFTYDWTENLVLDDSKPLTMVDHVGGAPLLAIIGRAKYSPKDYDLLVKWIKKSYGYFEDQAVPQMSDDEQEKFKQAMEFALPQLKRLDNATRTMLIPALADGQSAFVLDAKITSPQWHKDMPKLDKPLPMIEPAIVLGVSDADLFKKAFAEYRSIAQAVVDKVRELDPSAIPAGYNVPKPEQRVVSGGEVYAYVLPAEAGLDKQLLPNAGVGKSVAVASFSPKQTERILSPTPLKTLTTLRTGKPVGAVVHFDFAGLIDAASPWVDFAVRYNMASIKPGQDVNAALKEVENNFQAKFVFSEMKTAFDVLKCFRGYTSVTYREGGATVVQSATVFEDLK